MTEMQKQFEEWITENFIFPQMVEPLKKYEGCEHIYDNPVINSKWESWQASRAEIVVKLPSFFSDRYESEICFTDEVEKSLDDAGVSYE